jgi:long-chain acyl-CoA synthetase
MPVPTDVPALPQDLRQWARQAPDRPVWVMGEHQVSYGAIDTQADRLAQVLRSLGLQRGDHVASLMPNDPLALALPWACWRAGLYLTPISPAASAADALHVLTDCGARALIVHAQCRTVWTAMLDQCPTRLVPLSAGGSLPGCIDLDKALAAAPAGPIADESPGSLMMYTSGTTGRSRGVWRPLPPLGHAGPPPFVADLLRLFEFDTRTRYLSTAPLYHAAPLRFALTVTSCGGTVFALERFDAATALDTLTRHGITHSQWVPTMFQRLLALPAERRAAFSAPQHRIAFHAAAPCPPSVKRAMLDWWGPLLVEYYSGSEGVGLTAIDSAEWQARPGSVGRAKKGRIHVLDTEFHDLPAGQIGTVFFSGVLPFQYFNDPEKTATRTSPQGHQTLGDVGYVDEAGYLFLTDRLDDMIISGGVNLYPQEIESALLESALVLDCGVVGAPDERFGEKAVAFVVPGPDAASDCSALLTALTAHCEARLGRIKRPAELRLTVSIPRSPTGKLLRRELRLRLSDEKNASGAMIHDLEQEQQ